MTTSMSKKCIIKAQKVLKYIHILHIKNVNEDLRPQKTLREVIRPKYEYSVNSPAKLQNNC